MRAAQIKNPFGKGSPSVAFSSLKVFATVRPCTIIPFVLSFACPELAEGSKHERESARVRRFSQCHIRPFDKLRACPVLDTAYRHDTGANGKIGACQVIGIRQVIGICETSCVLVPCTAFFPV